MRTSWLVNGCVRVHTDCIHTCLLSCIAPTAYQNGFHERLLIGWGWRWSYHLCQYIITACCPLLIWCLLAKLSYLGFLGKQVWILHLVVSFAACTWLCGIQKCEKEGNAGCLAYIDVISRFLRYILSVSEFWLLFRFPTFIIFAWASDLLELLILLLLINLPRWHLLEVKYLWVDCV